MRSLSTDPLSVTQANQRARSLLEGQLGVLTVAGELANVKCVSGHWYMTLRDADSQLSTVLFKREASVLRFVLKDGMQVLVRGRLTIYSPYGRYQLMADFIEPQGQGALQIAFEQLKNKLEAEGLFAADRKRVLPLLPKRVGVITSPTGAVIRDICHVALRRFPAADILVFPASVQGVGSAPSIAEAIERASAEAVSRGLSVLIVARGGGSFEDLCGFNDERVARAIAASPIPVVSAVGHETDFTIADFVADVRAPTPSAAAELVFPVMADLKSLCQSAMLRAARGLRRLCSDERRHLVMQANRLQVIHRRMKDMQQRLTYATERMSMLLARLWAVHRKRLQTLDARLAGCHPKTRVAAIRHRFESCTLRMISAERARLKYMRSLLKQDIARLQSLSPLSVLDRGYAILLDAEGHAIRSPAEVHVQQTLTGRVRDGDIALRVDASPPRA